MQSSPLSRAGLRNAVSLRAYRTSDAHALSAAGGLCLSSKLLIVDHQCTLNRTTGVACVSSLDGHKG
jgi:hypothetical protein